MRISLANSKLTRYNCINFSHIVIGNYKKSYGYLQEPSGTNKHKKLYSGLGDCFEILYQTLLTSAVHLLWKIAELETQKIVG